MGFSPILFLIELIVVTRQKYNIRKERPYDVLSIQRESGNGTKKYSEKATSKKKQGKKNKHHVRLSGRLHIEGRLNEGPRLQRKHKDENEAKQNKRNTRERRHGICKPNARRIQVVPLSTCYNHFIPIIVDVGKRGEY